MGELIRQQRRLNGLTQKQLADKLGVSSLSIRFCELGKHTSDEDIFCRIAGALDISVETLHEHNIDFSCELLEMLFRMKHEVMTLCNRKLHEYFCTRFAA